MKLHLGDVGKIWIRVRIRPTKPLEPAYKVSWTGIQPKVFKKSQKCMPGSASPHSAARPRPPKKVVFWRQSTNFPLLHPGNGHISKTRTKTQLDSFCTDMIKKWFLRFYDSRLKIVKLLYLHFYTLLPVQQKNLLRHVNLEPRVFSFYLDLETKRYFLIWCISKSVLANEWEAPII